MQSSEFDRKNVILLSFILPHFGYKLAFFDQKQVCKQPRGTYTQQKKGKVFSAWNNQYIPLLISTWFLKKSSLKNQVRQTGFLVYLKLDACVAGVHLRKY